MSILFVLAVRIVGGRENFTTIFNINQGRLYEKHHVDWAMVLGIIGWPSTISNIIFKRLTRNTSHIEMVDSED